MSAHSQRPLRCFRIAYVSSLASLPAAGGCLLFPISSPFSDFADTVVSYFQDFKPNYSDLLFFQACERVAIAHRAATVFYSSPVFLLISCGLNISGFISIFAENLFYLQSTCVPGRFFPSRLTTQSAAHEHFCLVR
jgi:hypothetical protein